MTDSVTIADDDESPTLPPRRSEDLWAVVMNIQIWLTFLMMLYIQHASRNQSYFYGFYGWECLVAIVLGLVLAMAYPTPWRRLGFVPPMLTTCCFLLAVWHYVGRSLYITLALEFMLGFLVWSHISIVRSLHKFTWVRPDASLAIRFPPPITRAMLLDFAISMAIPLTLLAHVFFRLSQNGRTVSSLDHYIDVSMMIFFGVLLVAYSWFRLFRFTFELFIESLTRIGYKIVGHGENNIPLSGPVLIIANHACWWDPLFLAGVVPRPLTPMMTASFYDIWFLRPIMKHAIGVIRVPEAAARRETPEIQEAIAALNNGQCVVLFPEGYLRRKEDLPLRRFARGVHEILKARPETPVVACWIEGAWGSWCSWKGGPPAKGKRVDFRRKIDVGVAAPIKVPAAVLENHMATRVFLMNAVNAARPLAGVPALPEFTMPTHDDDKEPA